MNGGAIALGNHVVEVMVEKACALICLLTVAGSSEMTVAIGLYPRKAANNATVGGISER